MTPVPVYRVTSMEADEPSCLYNYEVTLQPIDESESNDIAEGIVSNDGYERRPKIYFIYGSRFRSHNSPVSTRDSWLKYKSRAVSRCCHHVAPFLNMGRKNIL